MKKIFFFILLLGHNSTNAQATKSIIGLLWSRADLPANGITKFDVDNSMSANVSYVDNDNTSHSIKMDLVTVKKNIYVFSYSDSRYSFWLFIGNVNSPTLRVSFQKIHKEPKLKPFESLRSWKMLANESGEKGFGDGTITQPGFDKDLLENTALSFKNISCCTNHKIKHCAQNANERADLSKKNHCVF